ncbi:Phospholipase A2-gamma, partial [Mucuna pruriens]
MSRATAAFGILLCLLLAATAHCQANCSTTCIAEQCNTIGIKYGKYCGVGYSGCAGEKPCDGLDACCMAHDNCVDRFDCFRLTKHGFAGMTHVKCHNKLKNCLIREQNSGKVGFSQECPYSIAAPTMIRGMDLAVLLSQLTDPSQHQYPTQHQ